MLSSIILMTMLLISVLTRILKHRNRATDFGFDKQELRTEKVASASAVEAQVLSCEEEIVGCDPVATDTESMPETTGDMEEAEDCESIEVREALPSLFAEHLNRLEPYSLLLIDRWQDQNKLRDDAEKLEQRKQISQKLNRLWKLQIAIPHALDLKATRANLYFTDSLYMTDLRQREYAIEAVVGTTLMEILANARNGDTVLLSVKDEGSQAITATVQEKIAHFGICKLGREHVRHSYLNVIRKTDDRYESLLELTELKRLEANVDLFPQLSAVAASVQLVSAGAGCGNQSSIVINGQEWSNNRRGLNIVVVDEDGQVVLSTTVDSFVTIYAENTLFLARKQIREENDSWTAQHSLVAHALGGIENRAYSNCLEAFEKGIRDGFRVFEADLVLTSDGHLVARHDWEPYLYDFLMQEIAEERKGQPLTLAEFHSLPILKTYTPLDFAGICQLLRTHRDVYVVTDTKAFDRQGVEREFRALVQTAREIDPTILQRIIPQIYREEMLEWVREVYEFPSYVYTLYQTLASDEEVYFYAITHPIAAVTMSESRVQPALVKRLQQKGIPTYVHTLNDFDRMVEYRVQGVHGFYTDFCLPSVWANHVNRVEVKRDVLLDVLQNYWATQYPDHVIESLMDTVQRVQAVDKLERIVYGVFKIDNLAGLKIMLAEEIEWPVE